MTSEGLPSLYHLGNKEDFLLKRRLPPIMRQVLVLRPMLRLLRLPDDYA